MWFWMNAWILNHHMSRCYNCFRTCAFYSCGLSLSNWSGNALSHISLSSCLLGDSRGRTTRKPTCKASVWYQMLWGSWGDVCYVLAVFVAVVLEDFDCGFLRKNIHKTNCLQSWSISLHQVQAKTLQPWNIRSTKLMFVWTKKWYQSVYPKRSLIKGYSRLI